MPFEHVVEEGTAIDLARRKARRRLHVGAPPENEVHLGALRRQAEGDIDARHRSENIGEHARTPGEARHLIEHDRRVPHAPLIDVDDAADLFGGFRT